MHARRTSARLDRAVAALAVMLLAGPALAADATAAAFRKLGKAAEKQVRGEISAHAAGAREALKNALAQYKQGAAELPDAMASAVTATAGAISLMTTAAADGALALRDEGATLLGDFVGEVGGDFLDGGGGAWDRYKDKTEAQLLKGDARVRAEFRKFVKGAAKVAKSESFDPDVRWRVRGHDRTPLDAIEGPAITALQPGGAEGVDVRSLRVTVESRFLAINDDFLQDIGVDMRGLDSANVQVMDDAGTLYDDLGLAPDTTGSFTSRAVLDAGVTGPVQTSLFDAANDDLLSVLLGSRSTAALPAKPQLIQFKQSLRQELKFAGNFIKGNTKNTVQSLTTVRKQHAQGNIMTVDGVQSAASASVLAGGNDRLLLGAIQGNPVINAASGFESDALTDGAVTRQFVPDGGADYTRFLDKLNRKLAGADRARGRASERTIDRVAKQAAKQGETVSITFDIRARIAQDGIQLNIVPNVVSDPVQQATVDMGALVRVENGFTQLAGAFGGQARPNLVATTPTVTEIGGIVIGGLLFTETSGAYTSRVPILGDLPVLGALFRNRANTLMTESLLVLVTPRVIIQE